MTVSDGVSTSPKGGGGGARSPFKSASAVQPSQELDVGPVLLTQYNP